MAQLNNLDFSNILKTAQDVASNIPESDLNNMDLDKVIDNVSDMMFKQYGGGSIDSATKQQMKLMSKTMLGQFMGSDMMGQAVSESKVDLGSLQEKYKIPNNDKEKLIEEIDENEEVPDLKPYVSDLCYKLSVDLEDLYIGKTKKLRVTRDRLDKSSKKTKQEKCKIEIEAEKIKGARDGQEFRFNREGNEKSGYQSGDIVVTLMQNEHKYYERHGSTLYTTKNISLYESYAAAKGDIKILIKHLNGSYLSLKVTDGVPLHAKDGSRKIKGAGMPVYGKKGQYGDLYIRFNLILPETFNDEKSLQIIEKLFPIVSNKDELIYSNKEKQDKYGFKSGNVKEIPLEEITEEDIEQIEYDQRSYYSEDEEEEESEESEEEESERSEDEDSKDKRRRNRRRDYSD